MRLLGLRLAPLLALLWLGGPGSALADSHQALPRTPSPEGARLYIISPADGDVVESPLTVRFGLSGSGVAPAGVDLAKTGHHHLVIDAELPDLGAPVPADANHVHFGGGQTEVVLELSPGSHTLQLLLADHLHIPHDPPLVSERISISVR